MKIPFKESILAASVIGCVGTAVADPMLTLSDGNGHSVTITGTSGALVFDGSLGDWSLNVTTGLGFPAIGTQTSPIIDLNSVDVYKGAGGPGNTLTMTFTDDNLGPLAGSFAAGVGGTLAPGSSFSLESMLNGNPLTTQSFPGSGAFSGSEITSGSGGFPSSLELEGIITATVGGSNGANNSFNAELRAVPDGGSTIALLGFALVGVGSLRNRLKK